VDTDPTDSGVSSETTNGLMSRDMFGPLSGMPDGTTPNSQVANACQSAVQRPNKMHNFILVISDTRSFLAWLLVSCSGGLMAPLGGEKFVVVPSTADVFGTAVSEPRSLDLKNCVRFHTFTLSEESCARLLVNNLARVCRRASSERRRNA